MPAWTAPLVRRGVADVAWRDLGVRGAHSFAPGKTIGAQTGVLHMNGVKVTLKVKLQPEAADGFCAALPEMVKDTAKRPGFRDLCVVRHATEPGTMIFIETWDSEQAYHDYIAWRTERGEMDGMASIVTEPPQLDFWPVVVAAA